MIKKIKYYNKLLATTKLNTIMVLVSRALIQLYNIYDEFVLVNVLREYNEIKKEMKNMVTLEIYQRF